MSLRRRMLDRIDRDPIILSHHPLCGRFDDHVFKVGGRYVCVGCATVYPSALATVFAFWFLDPESFWITTPIALSFFALNLVRFLVNGRLSRVPFNVFLGVSLGATLFSVVYAPENLRLVIVLVGLPFAVAFSFLKGRRMFSACKRCDRYREFPSCCFPRPEDKVGRQDSPD